MNPLFNNFSNIYSLDEILQNYEETQNYKDADEAYKEFVSDYEDELEDLNKRDEFGRHSAEGYASCRLNDFYAKNGYKLRYVVEDRTLDGDVDVIPVSVYKSEVRDGNLYQIGIEEAIKEAQKLYDHLTKSEKKKRVISALLGEFDYKGNLNNDMGVVEVLWTSEKEGI